MDELTTFSEYQDIKNTISYEMLLGRQVDRCLFYRTTDPMRTFFDAVQSLDMSLVDLPGKPLRSDFDAWLKDNLDYPYCVPNKEGLRIYDLVFKHITRILSKYRLLFRSTTIEVNR